MYLNSISICDGEQVHVTLHTEAESQRFRNELTTDKLTRNDFLLIGFIDAGLVTLVLQLQHQIRLVIQFLESFAVRPLSFAGWTLCHSL
jgi:hypothetical protein